MSEQLLRQAITAIKGGDKAAGGRLLAQVLKADPDNEIAWLWMAQAVQEPARRQHCLEHVLRINPQNETARHGLAILRQKQAATPRLKKLAPRQAVPPPAEPVPDETDQVEEQVLRARELVERGKKVKARQLLARALKADPTNDEAWLLVVTTSPTEAERSKALKQWLKLNPDSELARQYAPHLRQGKPNRAFFLGGALLLALGLFCVGTVIIATGPLGGAIPTPAEDLFQLDALATDIPPGRLIPGLPDEAKLPTDGYLYFGFMLGLQGSYMEKRNLLASLEPPPELVEPHNRLVEAYWEADRATRHELELGCPFEPSSQSGLVTESEKEQVARCARLHNEKVAAIDHLRQTWQKSTEAWDDYYRKYGATPPIWPENP